MPSRGGRGSTPNGKNHLKFPFWLFDNLPYQSSSATYLRRGNECIKLNSYIIYRFVWGSLVLADMYNINIQASASLSQSVLSYYTVLIHILYGQGYIIQVSILWLIEWVVCKTNHWLNLGQIKSEGFWLPTVLTSANGQPSDNLKTTHNNLW